jgi:DNA-binding NarL/FixJ family response regulator
MARAAVKAALQKRSDWVVVGEASGGRQALERFPRYRPEITVMDFLMPEMNGLEAAHQMIAQDPDIPVLMITTDPSSQLETEARKAGIKGVCVKGESGSLTEAVETVIHGGTYFSEEVAA